MTYFLEPAYCSLAPFWPSGTQSKHVRTCIPMHVQGVHVRVMRIAYVVHVQAYGTGPESFQTLYRWSFSNAPLRRSGFFLALSLGKNSELSISATNGVLYGSSRLVDPSHTRSPFTARERFRSISTYAQSFRKSGDHFWSCHDFRLIF